MMLTHHTSLTNTTGKVDLWKAFSEAKMIHVSQESIVGVAEMKVP
jgi:hypothetical protein